jgi:hypothetical protein
MPDKTVPYASRNQDPVDAIAQFFAFRCNVRQSIRFRQYFQRIVGGGGEIGHIVVTAGVLIAWFANSRSQSR